MNIFNLFFEKCGPVYALAFALLSVSVSLPKRERFAARSVTGLAVFVLLSLVPFLFDLDSMGTVYVRTVYHYFMYFVMVLLIWLCYDAPFIEVMYRSTIGSILQHSMYSFSEVFMLLSGICGKAIDSASPVYAVCNILIYAVAYGAAFSYFKSHLSERGMYINKLRLIIPILLLPTAATIMNMLIELTPRDPLEMLYYRLYSIMLCVSVFSIMFGISETGKMKQEMDLVKKANERQKEQYEIKKELIDLINIRAHDLKKQLGNMDHVNSLYDEKSRSRIEHDLFLYDFMAETGNETLDIILTDAGLRCEREAIKLTYLVDGKALDFIEPIDIYAIFGNLLDNAITSVEKLSDADKKVISLKMNTVGNMIYFHAFNYYEEEPRFENGLPQTTKEDGENHGFGTKSIQASVKKYGGELMMSAENHIFNVNFMLCR